MLTERQQRILSLVVDSYLESGKPVGSKAIASSAEVEWSASTVRAELAELERAGYLTHPHTSAGRVPTDAGYRFYADSLLASGPARRRRRRAGARHSRRCAARSTRRCARPPPSSRGSPTCSRWRPRRRPSTARIHRVEVLLLQPRVVMVVVIASNGAVTKRVFTFSEPLDPGLVEWASSYLNERLTGPRPRRADDRRPPRRPRARPRRSRGSWPRSTMRSRGSRSDAEADLYLEGAARLLSEDHAADLPRSTG